MSLGESAPASGPPDEGLEKDTIRDFSAHLKKEQEDEDSIRKLPGYFLIGAVLAISFLVMVALGLIRGGPLLENLKALIPQFAFSYALVGVVVLMASIFSQRKKLTYEIARILFTAAAILLILLVAWEFFVQVVRPSGGPVL